MRRKNRLNHIATLSILFLFPLFVLTAHAGHKLVNEPHSKDKMNVRIYELDNGLRVYLTENHEKPRFQAEIAVRAGSKHDPAETTGLAHYLEHLLFKGNRNFGTLDYEKEKPHLDRITELYEEHFREKDPDKRAKIYEEINKEAQLGARYSIPNEMDGAYQDMGAMGLNAFTSNEQTVYLVDLPANRLKQWAAIESDRFVNPVFRLFHTELETVYEEKNRSLDNKSSLLWESVNKALFKKHPYGQQTTIGEAEHLKNPSLKNILDFYNTWYVPNNMGIFISGDVDADETIRVIDERFSKWERKKLPKTKTWRETILKQREQVDVKFQGEEFVLLAFRLPGQNHKDSEAIQMLDMILSNAVAGLIDLNLNQKQRVRRAGCFPDLKNDFGIHYMYGIPKKDQSLEEVEKLILDQVQLVVAGEFEDWIIPAIVNNVKKDMKAYLESNRSRVTLMRDSFLAFQDWDYAVETLDRFEKVTRKDVLRVAKKYYTRSHVAGYRHDAQHDVPSIQKPKIDKIQIDPTRQSNFMKDVLAMKVRDIEPSFVDPEKDYRVARGPNGVKVYYSKNPVNDLFTLSFRIDVGTRQNNKINIASRLLDKSGTERLAADDLKKEWYKLGSDFNFGAGQNETVITVSGLDENLDPSIALAMEVLHKPKSDKKTLDEMVNIILVQREDAKKDPRSVGAALGQYNRYGKESSYLQMLPAAQVKKLTVGELHQLVGELLTYEHTIAYTGSEPLDKVLAVLDKHLPKTADLKTPPPYKYLKVREVEGKNEIYFFHKEMAQAQIDIEFGDEEYNEKNNPPSQLYNTYFAGGMGGIVFQELREAQGLAYSAFARYRYGSRKKDQNIMTGSIGTQADKTTDALAAFLDLFDNLPESPERFDKAVNYLVNRYRTSKIGFRGVISAVLAWQRLGLEPDPREVRYNRIRSSNINDMLDFHAARVKGRAKLISIVGDKTKIDMDQLAKHGTVKEITLDRIFVD